MIIDTPPLELKPSESPFAVELRKLDMQPGQTVLVAVPNSYSHHQMASIQQDLIKLVPDGCAVLVHHNEVAFNIIDQPGSLSTRAFA